MIDFSKIKTYPIKTRENKFKRTDFIDLNSSDKLLKHDGLELLAKKMNAAKNEKKINMIMIGGHVIKVGCSRILIDLMKKGFINHVGANGSVAIHDFEIALIGETSEDVAKTIEDGSFGMSEETGRMMNEAIIDGKNCQMGFGKSIGKMIDEKDLPYKNDSVLYNAYKLNIPCSIHTAIGTEIIYQHPSCDGAAMGYTSYSDFKLITETISKLEGGVVVNIGSAVIMPEVFLKAFTIARNLGYKIERFTAANLDMIKHYRPTVNVVERPTSLGGEGIQVIEKHQLTLPTLYHLLVGSSK